MTNKIKKFSRKLRQRFDEKQNAMERIPAVMGDGNGGLLVSGQSDFIYCQIGDKVAAVYNNRVPNQIGLSIWIGRTPEEPNLFQVLSTRSAVPAGVDGSYVNGYAPAKRYEWHAVGGGQDPLAVHLRAFTPLKLSVSDTPPETLEVYVNLYRGFIWTGAQFKAVARQDIDLYSYIPTTINKAAFVLITISNTGVPVMTKGSEVDIDALVITDIPALPGGTRFICGAVRVYYGQTKVQEGRTNTDIFDARYVWSPDNGTALWGDLTGTLSDQADLQSALDAASKNNYLITEDLTAQITGSTAHFDISIVALSRVHVYGNLRQQPADVTMDSDFLGFTLSYTPTTNDKLIVDYYPESVESFMYDDANNILVDDTGEFILEA